MAMAYAAVWFCILSIFFNLISIGIAAIRARPSLMPLPPPRAAPGVSVVRPLCGLDNFCEETLESSFQLDYPSYEIIFCVARANDPVVPLVHRLIANHPDRPARLIVGDEKVSANPKLNNCVRGWDTAHHDWIILADANVLMPKDYIQRLLLSWRRRSGLVCSMPLGSRPRNLWAELECAFLNTAVSSSRLASGPRPKFGCARRAGQGPGGKPFRHTIVFSRPRASNQTIKYHIVG